LIFALYLIGHIEEKYCQRFETLLTDIKKALER